MMTTILSVKFGVCSQELIYSFVDLANVHLQSNIYFSRRIVYMMLVFGLDIRLALIISYGRATINVSSCSSATNAMTSVTKILFDLGLPSFNTVMSNSGTVFHHMWSNGCNGIVTYLSNILC